MATRASYRRALAYALNDLGVYPVSSGTGTTVTIVTLADSTSDASTHRYDGRWVYLATGAGQGTQRRVKRGGFTPSSGALTLELSWTAPSSPDEVELTGLFPCQAGGLGSTSVSPEDPGYNGLVNRALSLLLVPDRVTLAITTADTYSTTTWPWLDRPERLVRVLEPAPVAGGAPVDASWRGPQLVVDGPAPFLQLNAPFSTATGTLTLDVLRPADTLISGAESTTGFTAEGQTAIASVNDVREIGLLEAYRALRHRGGVGVSAWEKAFEQQQQRVEGLLYFDGSMWRRRSGPAAGEAA